MLRLSGGHSSVDSIITPGVTVAKGRPFARTRELRTIVYQYRALYQRKMRLRAMALTLPILEVTFNACGA